MNTIQQSVDPNTTRAELLTAWVNKETGVCGHWGYNVNFRITLGSADEFGSIGFSQMLNNHKYGRSPKAAINDLNLYHPEDGIKGFAVFSNDTSIGGGFTYAFSGSQPYKRQKEFSANTYPRLHESHLSSNTYTDSNKDLLSKGIMAYNNGPGLPWVKYHTWPEALVEYNPPTTSTKPGTRTAIEYTLSIQNSAGVPLETWTWSAQRINTGTNGKCETTATGDDVQVIELNQEGSPSQVCISPGENGVIDTTAGGDDQVAEFQFTYSENEWLSGSKTWTEKMLEEALNN